MNSVNIFPDSNTLAMAIASRFREEAKQAASENRLYSVVLTGGNTAAKVYRLFSASGLGDELPWESVHLFWTDERCVSPQDDESNFGTALRTFIHAIPIPKENIHRIRGEEDPEKESNRYSLEIQNHLVLRKNHKYVFDWVLMGLGMDGHIASIFPGQKHLLSTKEFCFYTQHPETGQNRISLTLAAFKKAACISYHAIGQDKAKIISELVSKSPASKKYPAAHVSGEWYLDKPAASSLVFL